MPHVIAKINQLIQIYFFLFPYIHVHIYAFCGRLESWETDSEIYM